MNLALLLHRYFPYGGLQRDCVNLAIRLIDSGHEVSVVCRCWEGEVPEGLMVEELGARGLSNLSMDRHFEQDAEAWLAEHPQDCVVGFSRLALAMDFYYAADPCYALRIARNKPRWYRFSRRYRHGVQLEWFLFSAGGPKNILMLTDMEVPAYQKIYGTDPERLLVLPPSIRRRALKMAQKRELRSKIRKRMDWPDERNVILLVGSGFATKGLDRAIRAVASVSAAEDVVLYVAGSGKDARYRALAKGCGVQDRVVFLGGRDDAWELMLAADLLIHPARSENTGTVLVEALSAGTGVLTTAACGFASHVAASGAGTVLMHPFDQAALERALSALLADSWEGRAEAALRYAAEEDLYSGMDTAHRHIEAFLASHVKSDVHP
ncbi:glycosyltransferase family 4 protein [Verrucomicrobiaceae bacterium N1E253]|uniref:Glycosyltransferase family 4 protein n=1 Tax=Oceaniferula marina TaxID=2748318 RepID=A0A851GH15_9BACT|nr:glycosyltransferase family 4 protein [Oceaniferula marina]NWK56823.1 glycosyltransferase family 4 protein [Oceaniferula marina]